MLSALAALSAFTMNPGAVAAPAPEGSILGAAAPGAVPDRYIAVLKENAPTADLAGRYGAKVNFSYRHALNGFSASMTERQARRLAADPAVAFVEQVRTVSLAASQQNPPNWGDDRIDQRNLPLDRVYSYPDTAGQGVTVYVLDTGIRRSHQDFGGRASFGPDYVDNDNDSTDCHGHGTHVAGTAVGATYGVAKRANVVALRVLNCQGSGGTDGIVRAIDWVTANARKPAVANMSLGSTGTVAAMESAVRRSVQSGVQYSLAGGNSSADACGFSPAREPVAITVGATTNTDARASFSNYGRCLDIFAPGNSIVSASYSSDTGSATMSGTSMAAPHVAGAAALYLGANPNATAQQVRDALVNNGTTGKVTSPGSGSPNVLLYTGFIGGGDPNPPPPPPPGDDPPTASFTVTCAFGGPCAFDGSASSDPDGTVTGHAWSFGDGSTGSGATASHAYPNVNANYQARLTVTDNSGLTGTAQRQISCFRSYFGTAPICFGS